MRTDYVILCSMIPHCNLQPLIPLGPCGWFPGYSWRLAPIYHQPPWSWGAVPSTLRCGLSHFMVTLRGLNQIVRFGSMVCLLAGPAFYLRQWLHPNCIRTFSTWLSRLNKQLKVAVLAHHSGVLPCSCGKLWALDHLSGSQLFGVIIPKKISRSPKHFLRTSSELADNKFELLSKNFPHCRWLLASNWINCMWGCA